MAIRIEQKDGVMTAYLSGEIDHHSAAGMRTELDEKIESVQPKTLAIDMAEVSFMDSSGIGLVMGRYKLMREINGSVEIQNPPNHIKKVLRLSGLEKIVKI